MTTYRNVAVPAMPATSSDASFRQFVTNCTLAFTNGGWAQAADTGQIDPATVTLPSAGQYATAKLITYLNDSLHSTYPIYAMFSFGAGSVSGGLSVKVTFGHSTSGTGALTGFTTPTVYFAYGASTGDAGNGLVGYITATASPGVAFTRYQWGTSQMSTFLLVQREFDPSTGAVKAGGNYTFMGNFGTADRVSAYNVDRATGTVYSNLGYFCVPIGNASASTGVSTTEIYPHFGRLPSVKRLGASFTYFTGEVAKDSTMVINICGAPRTFMATGMGYAGVTSNATHGLAVLWE